MNVIVAGRSGVSGLARLAQAMPTFDEWMRSKGYDFICLGDSEGGEQCLWHHGDNTTSADRAGERLNSWELASQQEAYSSDMRRRAASSIAAAPQTYEAVQTELQAAQTTATEGGSGRYAMQRVAEEFGSGTDVVHKPTVIEYIEVGLIPMQEFPAGTGPNSVNPDFAPGTAFAEKYGVLTWAQVWSAIYGGNWQWIEGSGLKVTPGQYHYPFYHQSKPSAFSGFMRKAIPMVAAGLLTMGAGSALIAATGAESLAAAGAIKAAASQAISYGIKQAQAQTAPPTRAEQIASLQTAQQNIAAARSKNLRLGDWVASERARIAVLMNSYRQQLRAGLVAEHARLNSQVKAGQISAASATSEFESIIRAASANYSGRGRSLVSDAKRRFEIEKAKP